jgi:sortase (surface protein transpeptidase)
MAKTVYRVEGSSAGTQPPEPGSPSGSGAGRRRPLFWVLLILLAITLAMIIAIAALGATESTAASTMVSPASLSAISDTPTTINLAATSTTSPPVSSANTTAASTTSSSESTTTTLATHSIADPTRIVIPAMEVDASVVAVGLKDGEEMEVPSLGLVGWYKLGPLPGAGGPAVLVSHVSWNGKKGTFYSLKNLKPGDEIVVYGKTGDHASFQVDSSETILKAKLPTEKIWNNTKEAVIRLVTCGGKYDSKTGHYLSNVIVYGHLVE